MDQRRSLRFWRRKGRLARSTAKHVPNSRRAVGLRADPRETGKAIPDAAKSCRGVILLDNCIEMSVGYRIHDDMVRPSGARGANGNNR